MDELITAITDLEREGQLEEAAYRKLMLAGMRELLQARKQDRQDCDERYAKKDHRHPVSTIASALTAVAAVFAATLHK